MCQSRCAIPQSSWRSWDTACEYCLSGPLSRMTGTNGNQRSSGCSLLAPQSHLLSQQRLAGACLPCRSVLGSSSLSSRLCPDWPAGSLDASPLPIPPLISPAFSGDIWVLGETVRGFWGGPWQEGSVQKSLLLYGSRDVTRSDTASQESGGLGLPQSQPNPSQRLPSGCLEAPSH